MHVARVNASQNYPLGLDITVLIAVTSTCLSWKACALFLMCFGLLMFWLSIVFAAAQPCKGEKDDDESSHYRMQH